MIEYLHDFVYDKATFVDTIYLFGFVSCGAALIRLLTKAYGDKP